MELHWRPDVVTVLNVTASLVFAREHSHNVDTKVISLDSVEKVRVALFESQDDTTKVCFGSDATVVGIAPYSRDDHYSPYQLCITI